jgi:hypothetical protein
MTVEWAIALFSVSLPVSVSIYKWVPHRRSDEATYKAVDRLRADINVRLDNMQRDLNRIAVKTGTDLWGS